MESDTLSSDLRDTHIVTVMFRVLHMPDIAAISPTFSTKNKKMDFLFFFLQILKYYKGHRKKKKKINLLKMCGPQMRLCLFMFRPFASKQLYSWTTIDTLSWARGAEVTYPRWAREVTGSIPGSDKGFYVWCFVLLLCLYYLSKNTLFVTKFCNIFCILYILQDLWPIIRVPRSTLASLKAALKTFRTLVIPQKILVVFNRCASFETESIYMYDKFHLENVSRMSSEFLFYL